MGYEIKITVAVKSSIENGGLRYCTPIIHYYMGKNSEFSNYTTSLPKSQYYYYADDGDTRVIKDKYDDPLTQETDFDYLLKMLQLCFNEDCFEYWSLKQIIETLTVSKNKDNYIVLFFGY